MPGSGAAGQFFSLPLSYRAPLIDDKDRLLRRQLTTRIFQSSRLTLFFVAILWLNPFTLLRAPLPFGEIRFSGDAVGARQDRAFVYNVCLV